MAPLKGGEGWCFIHSPSTRSARSRARSKGGQANRRPALPDPPAAATSGGFEIGQIQKRSDVAKALLRLAHAIARGEVDVRRGRLVADALRAASAAASDGTELAETNDGAPLGAREATDAELAYVIEHGQLPEGVEAAGLQTFWVYGSEWRPPAIEQPAGDDSEGS